MHAISIFTYRELFSVLVCYYEHYSFFPTNKKGFVRQDSCIEFTSFYCSDIPLVQSINCNNHVKTLEKHCVWQLQYSIKSYLFKPSEPLPTNAQIFKLFSVIFKYAMSEKAYKKNVCKRKPKYQCTNK